MEPKNRKNDTQQKKQIVALEVHNYTKAEGQQLKNILETFILRRALDELSQ